MKKKKLESLSLNKKTISNFKSGVVGGAVPTNSCLPDVCEIEPTCTCDLQCNETIEGCDNSRNEFTCPNGAGASCVNHTGCTQC